jgi:hypothetical protein
MSALALAVFASSIDGCFGHHQKAARRASASRGASNLEGW